MITRMSKAHPLRGAGDGNAVAVAALRESGGGRRHGGVCVVRSGAAVVAVGENWCCCRAVQWELFIRCLKGERRGGRGPG